MADEVRSWPLMECFNSLLPESTHSDNLITPCQGNVTKAGSRSVISTFSPDDLLVLTNVYSALYSEHSVKLMNRDIFVPTTYKKFSYITWNGHRVKSCIHSSTQNPYVLATPVFAFPTETGTTPSVYEGDARLAKVAYFFTHSITLPRHSDVKSHLFACLQWPMIHPDRYSVGKPVEVWCTDLFEPSNINLIVPVDNIINIVIVSTDSLPSNETVLFSIPILK